MGMGTDRAYYEEVAQKAKSALETLQRWESGAVIRPFDEIKSLPDFLGNGFGLHKEVQDDLDIMDKTSFAEAVHFIKTTNAINQRSGANTKLSNALTTIERSCLAMAARKAQEEGNAVSSSVVPPMGSTVFVSESRISDLKVLNTRDWDLVRLVCLLEELNVVYRHGCFMATIMLLRAVTDYVPPIFGFTSFDQVAANYGGGGQSFKKATNHLQNSMKKIADSQLHLQARSSEALLNETTVHFQADLDYLLLEVLRILKQQSQR